MSWNGTPSRDRPLGKQQTGKLDEARALADELVVVATRRQDPSLELEACHAGWTTRFSRDELHSVVELTGRGLALYDVEQHRDHRYSFGHAPGMCAHTVRAMSLLWLGFADQARSDAEQATALADELAHAVSSSYALSLNCHVFRFRREAAVVEQWIKRQLALCEEYGFVGQAPFGEVFHGWARSAQGDTEAGIPQIRRALEVIRGFGIKTISFPLTALAEAHMAAGEYREAMEANEEAVAVATTVGESRWEPEVFRLRGTLLLATTGEREAAEVAYRTALDITRAQGARWFELRAAASLARLIADDGRREPAYELLCGITGWFTEGADTADLAEARTLLEQLA